MYSLAMSGILSVSTYRWASVNTDSSDNFSTWQLQWNTSLETHASTTRLLIKTHCATVSN